MKLTIELVPKTSWFKNLRSELTKKEWDLVRHKCYEKAGNICEVCGDTGFKQRYTHAVECHEIWNYNDKTHEQTLTGLIALCPHCHMVKHPGLAQKNGKLDVVIKQLMKVNSQSFEQAVDELDKSFAVWRQRSEHKWTVDTSFLETYLDTKS